MRTRMAIIFAASLIVGCAGILPSTQKGVSLLLKPCITEGYLTQATVSVYDRASIDHLSIIIFQGGSEIASKTISQAQLDNPIVFSYLKVNTSYRIKSYAYLANNALISYDDATSWLDFTTGVDDRPGIANLPVHLVDRSFNAEGTSSIQITNGGYLNGDPENMEYYSRLITTVAGNGPATYAGDGGAATAASIKNPYDVTVAGNGTLYIADWDNNRVRKVSLDGVITTVAGNGTAGYNAAHDGGPATSASVNHPGGVALDGAGNLYIAEGSNHIRKVSPAGTITTVVGNGSGTWSGDGGPATSASINNPMGIKLDGNGNLYIADWSNHRVRKVSPDGIITTVAGNGTAGYSAAHDGGPATCASLRSPADVDLDSQGNLYIAERDNHRVRKVTPEGIITTVAGNGVATFGGDGGPATSASLYWPWGLAVDPLGNIFIADEGNQRIRRVSTEGTITTVGGNGTTAYDSAQEGILATNAAIYSPVGLAGDSLGNLYVAVYNHSRIRKLQWGSLGE